jgi:hypothetical protein
MPRRTGSSCSGSGTLIPRAACAPTAPCARRGRTSGASNPGSPVPNGQFVSVIVAERYPDDRWRHVNFAATTSCGSPLKLTVEKPSWCWEDGR